MALKYSFCTIAYRNMPEATLAGIFENLAAAGYDGAEIWWPHVENLSQAQLAEAKACAKQHRLAVPILSPYLGNFNLEMTNRGEMIERTLAAAPVAEALGAPLLRAFAGWTCECSSLTAKEDYWRYNLDGFKEMAAIARDHGLRIAIETHYATLCDSVAGFNRFVDHCGETICANLQLDDIAKNSNLPDGVAVYRAVKDRVAHAHVPHRYDESSEGKAKLDDHRKVLAALAAAGFTGFVSVEHCKGDGDPFEAAEAGRKLYTA